MKKMKIITLAGACCLTALAGGLLAQNSVQAAAEVTAPNAVTEVENHFFMETGAAVRKNAGSVGIRYVAYVSEDWYNLASENGAKKVTFYTEIDKNGNVDPGEARPVDAKEALEFTSEYDGSIEKYAGRTNLYKFTGSITYTNLDTAEWTDAQRTQAYNMQLVGQAYAKIDGVDDPIAAYQNDNVRSMGEVADNALKAEESAGNLSADTGDLTTTEETKIAGYRTLQSATVYVDDVTYNTMDVGATYAGANILKVKMADTGDTYDTNAGTFDFNDDVATATAASDAYATVYTDKGIIETNFKVCTRVIKSVEDWRTIFNATGSIKGYYYLANDITEYPNLVIDKTASSANAFSGVFDGGGHTASFTVQRKQGVFAYLSVATVKNVQFNLKVENLTHPTNGTLCGNMVGLAATIWNNVKISDMYLKIESITSANGIFAPLTNDLAYSATITRTVIEMPSSEYYTTNSLDTTKISSFATTISQFDSATGVESDNWNYYITTDVFIISELPLARNIKKGQYDAASAFTVNAPNVSTVIDVTNTDNKITYLCQKAGDGVVYAYATKQALTDAVTNAEVDLNDYTGKTFWNTTTGFPVFVG